MEEGVPFHLLDSDILLSLLSVLFFVLDIVLDTWAVVSLYQEREYIYMGVLIFLLIYSSVLQQIFSWLWYSDSSKCLETSLERLIKKQRLVGVIHILQLGIFLRFAGMMEISFSSYKQKNLFDMALERNLDLSTLRLFEAFSENAPQIVLMVINIIQGQELQLIAVLKLSSSLTGLSLTMWSYHRNMRAFINEKAEMGWLSSAVYFLWNLLLISPRVMCIALFASILPCYIVAHFLSLWTLLVFWAWRQKTDFMDNKAGEWLYRATIGLIWYFSWFNVASGNTKLKGIVYHALMALDMTLLLGLWWWQRSVESARFGPLPVNPYWLIAIIGLIYLAGLGLKLLYYWKCHPNQRAIQLSKTDEPEPEPEPRFRFAACSVSVETDSNIVHTDTETEPKPAASGIHKRMRNMAVDFFS